MGKNTSGKIKNNRQWKVEPGKKGDAPQQVFFVLFGWESSSLYTHNTILCSVHYMIHYSAISNPCRCRLSIYQSA